MRVVLAPTGSLSDISEAYHRVGDGKQESDQAGGGKQCRPYARRDPSPSACQIESEGQKRKVEWLGVTRMGIYQVGIECYQ